MDLQSGSERLQAWGGAVIAPRVSGESLASQARVSPQDPLLRLYCVLVDITHVQIFASCATHNHISTE